MCATSSCLERSGSTVRILLLQEDACFSEVENMVAGKKALSLGSPRRWSGPTAFSAKTCSHTRYKSQPAVGGAAPLQGSFHSPTSPPGGWDTPTIGTSAPVHLHFILHMFLTAFLPSPLTWHHLSAVKTHYKFANFTPFRSLLRAFGLKMAFPFNWVCRSGLSQSWSFSLISSSFE